MKSLFKSAIDETMKIHESIESRVDVREFRVEMLQSLIKAPLVKNAFDTRRTNQYVDFNPRRNLQHYHRSEAFITKDSSEKIKNLFKLKTTVDSIKDDFISDPEWLDSYCRILCNALDRTLRIEQKDMDFFRPQMDYLEELLYLRYRLKEDDIARLGEKELRNIILDRDEKLLHKQIYSNYNDRRLLKQNTFSYHTSRQDNLIDTLFGNVKANNKNKEVKRSIIITINDKIM